MTGCGGRRLSAQTEMGYGGSVRKSGVKQLIHAEVPLGVKTSYLCGNRNVTRHGLVAATCHA